MNHDDTHETASGNEPPVIRQPGLAPPAPGEGARPPGTGPFGSLIPTSNPHALIGYYVGVGSLIPCLGAVLGPVAVVLGVLGLRAIKLRPGLPGKAHAYVAIVLGGLTGLAHIVGIIAIVASAKPSP